MGQWDNGTMVLTNFQVLAILPYGSFFIGVQAFSFARLPICFIKLLFLCAIVVEHLCALSHHGMCSLPQLFLCER